MQAPTEIPLSEIDADALPRDRSVTDTALMAELEQSVAIMGLRQPIEVWHLHSPRPPFRYGLISGFRRLAACRALGHSTIPAFLRTPSSIPEAMADMVAENEVRSQITPWEKGRFILATVDEGPFETPWACGASPWWPRHWTGTCPPPNACPSAGWNALPPPCAPAGKT